MEATALHRTSRGDGERVSLGGLDIIFKITSDQTSARSPSARRPSSPVA
jgi:hypothetical protein